MFVDATKLYQFKAKNSEIKDYVLCLGYFSKDFAINNMKKKTRLKRVVKLFLVYFNHIDTNDTLDIHKYLMKITCYKIMFGLIKKIFFGLLTGLVNMLNYTKCVSLSNQKCMAQPTLINVHLNECECECKYKLGGTKCNLNQMWNNNKCQWECKKTFYM